MISEFLEVIGRLPAAKARKSRSERARSGISKNQRYFDSGSFYFSFNEIGSRRLGRIDYWRNWRNHNERNVERISRSIGGGFDFDAFGILGALCTAAFASTGIEAAHHFLHADNGIGSGGNGTLGDDTHVFWRGANGGLDDVADDSVIAVGADDGRFDDFASTACAGGNFFVDEVEEFDGVDGAAFSGGLGSSGDCGAIDGDFFGRDGIGDANSGDKSECWNDFHRAVWV